jgi:hypothetical protein
MTKIKHLPFVFVFLASVAFAQESPSPTETASASSTPEQTPSPSPSVSAARNVPLRFVPPPMEGTISLGIFDSNDKLVRVLHREAKIDNFTIDENALKTTWDGKNDGGEDLPAGKYRARGYLVGKLRVEEVSPTAHPPLRDSAPDHIPVKLVINPLISDTRVVMEIAVGFDNKGSFLKTMDNLPLLTINAMPNLTRVAIAKIDEKPAIVWQDDSATAKEFHIFNIDKMMAFDCGFFELN